MTGFCVLYQWKFGFLFNLKFSIVDLVVAKDSWVATWENRTNNIQYLGRDGKNCNSSYALLVFMTNCIAQHTCILATITAVGSRSLCWTSSHDNLELSFTFWRKIDNLIGSNYLIIFLQSESPYVFVSDAECDSQPAVSIKRRLITVPNRLCLWIFVGGPPQIEIH